MARRPPPPPLPRSAAGDGLGPVAAHRTATAQGCLERHERRSALRGGSTLHAASLLGPLADPWAVHRPPGRRGSRQGDQSPRTTGAGGSAPAAAAGSGRRRFRHVAPVVQQRQDRSHLRQHDRHEDRRKDPAGPTVGDAEAEPGHCRGHRDRVQEHADREPAATRRDDGGARVTLEWNAEELRQEPARLRPSIPRTDSRPADKHRPAAPRKAGNCGRCPGRRGESPAARGSSPRPPGGNCVASDPGIAVPAA